MKKYCTFLILLAFACNPKNEEVSEEQIDLSPPAAAIDSVVSVEKDGTKIDQVDQATDLPLPQPVLQLLAQKYPGYEQPSLAEGILEMYDEDAQGPYMLSGFFSNDTYLDYALQLQKDKDIYVVAVLDTSGTEKWVLHELKRDILFNDRGTLRSVYRLMLTESGQSVTDLESGEKLELKRDAISVGFEDNVTTYVYRNNKFKRYAVSR